METTDPSPPRIAEVRLPDLVDADGDALEGDETRQRERFAAADLTGRDLAHAAFTECAFEGVRLSEADLVGVQLGGCRLTEIDASLLRASRSGWRRTVLTRSRIGAAELYETDWQSVVVSDSKIGYLNARAARWRDVRITDSIIDELDLGAATITRLSLERCQISTLHTADATLADVDLRGADLGSVDGLTGLGGATISADQLLRLAPALAAQLRIAVG